MYFIEIMIIELYIVSMSNKIFIGNLNYETTNDQLQSFLSQKGLILSCEIVVDKFSLKSKGFAYAEVKSEEYAEIIINSLNGKTLNGRPLKIDYYKK